MDKNSREIIMNHMKNPVVLEEKIATDQYDKCCADKIDLIKKSY